MKIEVVHARIYAPPGPHPERHRRSAADAMYRTAEFRGDDHRCRGRRRPDAPVSAPRSPSTRHTRSTRSRAGRVITSSARSPIRRLSGNPPVRTRGHPVHLRQPQLRHEDHPTALPASGRTEDLDHPPAHEVDPAAVQRSTTPEFSAIVAAPGVGWAQVYDGGGVRVHAQVENTFARMTAARSSPSRRTSPPVVDGQRVDPAAGHDPRAPVRRSRPAGRVPVTGSSGTGSR